MTGQEAQEASSRGGEHAHKNPRAARPDAPTKLLVGPCLLLALEHLMQALPDPQGARQAHMPVLKRTDQHLYQLTEGEANAGTTCAPPPKSN